MLENAFSTQKKKQIRFNFVILQNRMKTMAHSTYVKKAL